MPPPNAPATLRGQHVLLVEDEPIIAFTLEDELSEQGHEVRVAGDGLAALRLLDTGVFDAVVCDLRLPGASGMDVLRHARSTQAGARLLLVTAFADAACRADLDALGVPLLEKPLDHGVLLDWVAGARASEPAAAPGKIS